VDPRRGFSLTSGAHCRKATLATPFASTEAQGISDMLKEGDKHCFEGDEEFQFINGLLFKKRMPEG
jgi:hypothetical protein